MRPRSEALPPNLAAAIEAFAVWDAERASPRDVIARVVDRGLEAAARAEVATVVYGTIRALRRLEWLLGPVAEELTGTARATALVLAQCVATEMLEPSAAAARLQAFAGERLDFAAIARAEARLIEIDDPLQRFALRHSLPDWLAARFVAEFGGAADAVAAAGNAAPPRTIRANRLRVAGRQQLARELAEAGIASAPTPFAPDGLLIDGDASLFDTEQYRAGAFEQQDEGSQLVALAVAPPPRGRVLDACAGSGGKALALAAMLGNAGELVAIDVSEARIAALRERARRAGAHNLRAATTAEDRWSAAIETFARRADRILLDVPCSGTGSWRRRPEARWLLAPGDLDVLLEVQRALLDRAAAALQPGARIVYATCSLLAVENEQQVTAALQRHPQLERVRIAEILGGATASAIAGAGGVDLSLSPHRHGTDGFYAAILRRRRA